MAAQPEEKKEESIDPKSKAFTDCLYPSELILGSSEDLAKHTTSLFYDNVDWVSTSYHLESSELTQKSGKEECYKYFVNDIFGPNKIIGYTNNVQKMEIKGLSGTVLVEV